MAWSKRFEIAALAAMDSFKWQRSMIIGFYLNFSRGLLSYFCVFNPHWAHIANAGDSNINDEIIVRGSRKMQEREPSQLMQFGITANENEWLNYLPAVLKRDRFFKFSILISGDCWQQIVYPIGGMSSRFIWNTTGVTASWNNKIKKNWGYRHSLNNVRQD